MHDTFEGQLRRLQSWRDDAARELRELETRFEAMAATLEKLVGRVEGLLRDDEIAAGVAARLAQRTDFKLQRWHVVLGVVALGPGYIGLIILIAKWITGS